MAVQADIEWHLLMSVGVFWCLTAGVSGNDFSGFGNGNRKFHSQSSGTERKLKKPIPKFQEQEGNKKIHSQVSGMGRE